MDTVVASSNIIVEEHRSTDGLDAYVPRILRNGGLYDPDVDRFFLDLPLNGVRSRHSLRAYGYDIAIWLRFLADARDKTVWAADREDVKAFHRARRRGEAGSRISAASWNRSVAAMDKLYAWGVSEGLLSSGPFTHREVWRRIARQIRKAARADIVRIMRRFREPIPPPLDPHLQILEGEVRARIEARGVLLHTDREYKRLLHARGVRGLLTGDVNLRLHERYYLTSQDVVPFIVFLALETGLEIECCKTLTVDCLQNPANGTVEIAYVKLRARGAEHKTLRVRDGGLRTPGGIIRQIIALTAAARRHRPSDCLWLHYSFGGLKSGLKHPQYLVDGWTRKHDIRDDDGQMFHLELSRLRKTHKALWYLKTEGHITRFAVGHSREIAARHYADVPALRPLHEATIAEAFHEVVLSAASPIILTPEKEDDWRREPANASPALPAGSNPISLLDGEQDIWLASCGGFFSSPFADAGSPCALPFWGCLECPNAVITARKLPAILVFLDFLQEQRNVLSAVQWELKFAAAYARITRQILPAFSPTMITEARNALEREPVSLYLPPEVSL